jgi:hypothetical protein
MHRIQEIQHPGWLHRSNIEKIEEKFSSPALEATRLWVLRLKGKCDATRPTPKRFRVF